MARARTASTSPRAAAVTYARAAASGVGGPVMTNGAASGAASASVASARRAWSTPSRLLLQPAAASRTAIASSRIIRREHRMDSARSASLLDRDAEAAHAARQGHRVDLQLAGGAADHAAVPIERALDQAALDGRDLGVEAGRRRV